jgi:hypothetical protein
MSAPGEAAPPLSGYERLKRLRARRRADGLRELVLWLPPELHDAAKAHAAELMQQHTRATVADTPGAADGMKPASGRHTLRAASPAPQAARRPGRVGKG